MNVNTSDSYDMPTGQKVRYNTGVDTNLIPWLVNELEIRGWSQRELSRRSGVSQSTVSDVLSYKRQPTWDFCAAIAKALGVEEDEVFVLAGLKRPPLTPVAEEAEAIGILRELSGPTRQAVMQMLRGVARAEDLPTGSSESAAAQPQPPTKPAGVPADHPFYDEETLKMMIEIAEGLEKISPQKREELTAKYLMLLEIEEMLDHKFADEAVNE